MFSVDKSTKAAKNVGVVDRVLIGDNGDGTRFVKVRTRLQKVPEIGDKFSSRHGQKGTIGMCYTQENMPFTREGLVPDIIINPHCVPSRMTIAHVLETVTGKVTCLTGQQRDADAFQGHDLVEKITRALHEAGYERNGNEVMYCPQTGKSMAAKVFLGPVYYQRLKHLVGSKIHARARGRNLALTRQPTEGRGQDGGLRVGEMERDALLAHGASEFLRGRLCLDSDVFTINVCETCGQMLDKKIITNVAAEMRWECASCLKDTKAVEKQIPYAAKLLFQELRSAGISCSFKKPKQETKEEVVEDNANQPRQLPRRPILKRAHIRAKIRKK